MDAKSVTLGNCLLGNCPSWKLTFWETSFWESDLLGNCRSWKLTFWELLSGNMTFLETVVLGNFLLGKILWKLPLGAFLTSS